MGTRTKKEMVEVEKQVRVCDICKTDIPETIFPATCEMCGRDIHDSCSGLPCVGYNEEEDTTRLLCSVCSELGKAYWELVKRQDEARDKAFEKWREECEDHRYDD